MTTLTALPDVVNEQHDARARYVSAYQTFRSRMHDELVRHYRETYQTHEGYFGFACFHKKTDDYSKDRYLMRCLRTAGSTWSCLMKLYEEFAAFQISEKEVARDLIQSLDDAVTLTKKGKKKLLERFAE